MSLLVEKITSAFEEIKKKHKLQGEVLIEKPREENNGDFATNFAMINSKLNSKNPRDLAQLVVNDLRNLDIFSSVDIAGPGFINMKLNDALFKDILSEVIAKNKTMGNLNQKI
ncbi:hypothetical protein [Spiroplasma clarkii]|uniref:hypothetical protein n=1 Tax=Spiroplasma clarkii TaxID=2139 RepID=UPI001F460323|nr:hypothetical protein [Spiroplasma clarkii]